MFDEQEDNISPEQLKGERHSAAPSFEKKEPPPNDETIMVKAAEYEKLVRELAEYKDKYTRLFAEFDNARKRMGREKMEFVKYANEGLLVEFLNILDDLERSVEAAKAKHEDYSAFLKGIEMVMAHVYEMLKKNNVKPVESLGTKFDPHCHEALMQEETNQAEDDVIVEEFQKGYALGDRIIRSAKVKVAKKKIVT